MNTDKKRHFKRAIRIAVVAFLLFFTLSPVFTSIGPLSHDSNIVSVAHAKSSSSKPSDSSKNSTNKSTTSNNQGSGSSDSASQSGPQGGSKFGINWNTNPGSQWSRLAGVKNGLFGKQTKSSYTISYSDLIGHNTTLTEGEGAEYGMILGKMGLDHSGTSGFGADTTYKLGRMAGGVLLIIGEALNFITYWAFKNIMNLFNWINPMYWISNGTPSNPDGYALGDITGLFKHYISDASSLGRVLVSLYLGFALFAAFFGIGNQYRGGGMGRNLIHAAFEFFRRLFNIVVLPTFCCGLLAVATNALSNAFDNDGNSPAEYATYSALTDDEQWYQHSRLALPSELDDMLPAPGGTGTASQSGTGDMDSTSSDVDVPPTTHKMALEINSEGAGLQPAQTALKDSQDKIIDNPAAGDSSTPSSPLNSDTMQIIMDWMGDTQYTSANWSAYVRGHLPQGTDNWSASQVVSALESSKPITQGADGNTYSGKFPYILNGTLQVTSANGGTYRTDPPESITGQDTSADDIGGLSTVGMYNYLSTVFYPTGMTWTNSTSLLNVFTEPEHKAVSLNGKGITAIGIFLLLTALMLTTGIVGAYIVAYIMKQVAMLVMMIWAYVFGNALGILGASKSLFKATISIIALFVGGGMVYMVADELLIAVVGIPDRLSGDVWSSFNSQGGFISTFFGSHITNTIQAGAFGSSSYGFVCIFIGLLMYLMTFWMCKSVKPIMKALNSWGSTLADKIFGEYDVGNTKSPVGGGGNNYSGNSFSRLFSSNNSNNNGGPGGATSNSNSDSDSDSDSDGGNSDSSGLAPQGGDVAYNSERGGGRANEIKDAGRKNYGDKNSKGDDNNKDVGGRRANKTNANRTDNPKNVEGNQNDKTGIDNKQASKSLPQAHAEANGNESPLDAAVPATAMAAEQAPANDVSDDQTPGNEALSTEQYMDEADKQLEGNTNQGNTSQDQHNQSLQQGDESNEQEQESQNAEQNANQTANQSANQSALHADHNLSQNGNQALSNQQIGAQNQLSHANRVANSKMMGGRHASRSIGGKRHGARVLGGKYNARQTGISHSHMQANGLQSGQTGQTGQTGGNSALSSNNGNNATNRVTSSRLAGQSRSRVSPISAHNARPHNKGIVRSSPLGSRSRQLSASVPKTATEARNGVRSALADKHSADLAVNRLHGQSHVNPQQLSAVKDRQKSVNGRLRNAKLAAATFQQSRPVTPHMLRQDMPSNMPRPTNAQAHSALKSVYASQRNLVNTYKAAGGHSTSAVRSAGSALDSAQTHAHEIGLSDQTFAKPQATKSAISELTRGVNKALSGK